MKRITYLPFIVLAISLSSCIELFEEVTFNENKSGEAHIAATFPTAENPKNQVNLESLEDIQKLCDRLKKVEGVSNVRNGKKDRTLEVWFEFENPEALEHGLWVLYGADKLEGGVPSYTSFKSKDKLVRYYTTFYLKWDQYFQFTDFINQYYLSASDEEKLKDELQVQKAKLLFTYHLPWQVDTNYTNELSTSSNNLKTVSWSVTAEDINKDKKCISNSIRRYYGFPPDKKLRDNPESYIRYQSIVKGQKDWKHTLASIQGTWQIKERIAKSDLYYRAKVEKGVLLPDAELYQDKPVIDSLMEHNIYSNGLTYEFKSDSILIQSYQFKDEQRTEKQHYHVDEEKGLLHLSRKGKHYATYHFGTSQDGSCYWWRIPKKPTGAYLKLNDVRTQLIRKTYAFEVLEKKE